MLPSIQIQTLGRLWQVVKFMDLTDFGGDKLGVNAATSQLYGLGQLTLSVPHHPHLKMERKNNT